MAKAALAHPVEEGAHVPQLWHLEVGNDLLVAVQRDRLTLEQTSDFPAARRKLPISAHTRTDLTVAFALARACANRTLMLSTVSWRNDAGANSPRCMPHQRVLPLSPGSHAPKKTLVPSCPYWLALVLQ